MSNGAMKLTLAAAVVTTAASLLYASAFSGKIRRDRGNKQHFNVPNEILQSDECRCKEEVVLAVRLALEGKWFILQCEIILHNTHLQISSNTHVKYTAGKNMTQHYDSVGTADENISDLDISTKSNAADFATAIDVLNENYISSAINKHFPKHLIIGEEDVGTGTIPRLTKEPTWILDPIDGTTNFASGLPLSCVSIGYCMNGQPYMGVVFAPMTNELYIGVRGLGAYRNGVRLLGCTGEKATKSLSNAVVCFEFGYARTEKAADDMVNAVRNLLKHGIRTTRTLGAGVLDLCYVACGRMDVVYTGLAGEGWKPWDYCAALVVAMEGGCTITHLKADAESVDENGQLLSGYEFNMYSKTMVCGVNEMLVEETQKVVLGL